MCPDLQTMGNWVDLSTTHATAFSTRPDWGRLEADHDYFCRLLSELFTRNGYQVLELRVYHDPREEVARECGVVLQRDGKRYVGLGLRQDLVVTSDVVGRLGRALRTAQAAAGLVITTSFFTAAAVEAARGLSIRLYNRHQLWELLALD